jgi:chorismate dehydratase
MLHGNQQGQSRLHFCVPSECAARIDNEEDDLGIVPVIEVHRQGLLSVPGTGIACDGPVRSILLISPKNPARIRTLAADAGSRTSVILCRILLRLVFSADVEIVTMEPDVEAMLGRADAALLIGDAALRLDPSSFPGQVLDLGQLWKELTGLPMVFAVWAGRPARVGPLIDQGIAEWLQDSLQFGLQSLNTIIDTESRLRGFSPDLTRRYLTQHIRFEIGERENRGMARFLQHAAQLDALVTSP